MPPGKRRPYGTMVGMSFGVARDVRRSETVLSVTGDLDIATIEVLRTEVEDAVTTAPQRLYLDLSAADFIDSTGCRELLRAVRHGSSAGVPVELVVPSDNWRVRRVVDFMQFGELLPVHDQAPWG